MHASSGTVHYAVMSPPLSCALTSLQNIAINQMTEALHKAQQDEMYSSAYASIYCPFDSKMQHVLRTRVLEVGIIDYCILIGIGGSSLGFRAIYDALQDQVLLKQQNVCVLETVDSASIAAAVSALEVKLAKKARVHVSVISKSGATTETIAIWRVIQPILQKHDPVGWAKKVTIITDAESPLAVYAHDHAIATLDLPALVGGRYSVFSFVGLFPLALCGLDIEGLITGARDAVDEATMQPLQNVMPLQHAIALLAAYQHGYQVHDTFIFSTWCTTIGLWYRQLAAESLGKARERDQKVIVMIPTVSVGSTDLHSIGQLYLSGADNFWTTHMIVQEDSVVKTNSDHALDACVSLLNNRPLTEIMTAIMQGTLQAYQEAKIPFSILTITKRTPYTVGYVMQSYMLAIMYAGALLEVNPFNQPDVERYKKFTRELLGCLGEVQ